MRGSGQGRSQSRRWGGGDAFEMQICGLAKCTRLKKKHPNESDCEIHTEKCSLILAPSFNSSCFAPRCVAVLHSDQIESD